MNGQYPVCSVRPAESGAIKAWYDFFSDTRHWELEPYYDVDGGRAVALEGVEYVLYVEKPSGPVEVRVEKHGYDVAWFNPENGEFIRLKNWKGERFAAEPPDTKHDWVLYLSREGKKESMLTSWKFESRPILLQEVEQSVAKIPFVIDEPAKDDMSLFARRFRSLDWVLFRRRVPLRRRRLSASARSPRFSSSSRANPSICRTGARRSWETE